MKNLKFFYVVGINCLLSMLLSSCQEEENLLKEQEVQFSFAVVNSGSDVGRSGSSETENIRYVYLTIKDETGKAVYAWHTAQLHKFGSHYITKPLLLKEGNYTITNYAIMDSARNFVYATPREDRNISYLVEDPLPVEFTVSKDDITEVKPEVIPIDLSSDPKDFGYASFGLNEIDIVHGYIAVLTRGDYDRFILSNADLEIYARDWQEPHYELIKERDLYAKNNLVTFSRAYNQYRLRINKPGYITYEDVFSITELGHFYHRPLQVYLQKAE
ncbi:hypothetical protein LVD17_04120 [Fulvivirga ulvae]|uniref:hypothetical protein n=1 Tax=Fulvivirga ulvae TaxID=2904245 RepID=UPI001F303E9C|nr:hypothetical protein [Fulvivirga ulvae]UII33014.1 hypothetical protein LVD17_04120 [Fulvivirga ulvae]